MTEVDFTEDLWMFASPWCEDILEDYRYFEAIARAWVALWNYTVDDNSTNIAQVRSVCGGLFDTPFNQLIDILAKRKAVFFPDDNRLIVSYRIEFRLDEFYIFVEFAEPKSQKPPTG